ncbi:helix-turn-helix transcriptional regulator [Yoonia sp. SS1-5]|uniref:Helix-turn-helix transcriptional regulator n=1 Tax=Yoonia rhodophyticola TaxID=3137370 RepID=A0AAN0MDK0_9RHOB
MRASRLLQILLLLQNRGRLTATQLATELEVTPRTILRDVDAMTEAGLPIIVFQGNQGGIELGFNYRTRLTGLDREEAEALGIILGAAQPALTQLGLADAARRATAKLIESFPDKVRDVTQMAIKRFPIHAHQLPEDPRVAAFAAAVRGGRIVRIRASSDAAQVVHPIAVRLSPDGWYIGDALTGDDIPLDQCGDINISAHRFAC